MLAQVEEGNIGAFQEVQVLGAVEEKLLVAITSLYVLLEEGMWIAGELGKKSRTRLCFVFLL